MSFAKAPVGSVAGCFSYSFFSSFIIIIFFGFLLCSQLKIIFCAYKIYAHYNPETSNSVENVRKKMKT